MLADLVLQKNYLIVSTVLKFLNNLSNFTSVNILRSAITEALPHTVKASAYKKLVLTISIAIYTAIQQYSKNAPCIFNNKNSFYKNLEFTKRPHAPH